MTNNNSKKGFTLVELSIVLVIIGLLIGGILVAQSMIGTAKIQALVRQTGSFDAAIANFETKFNALPGDSSAIYATGNNDGLIQTVSSTPGTALATTFNGEIANFWRDLSITGLSTDGAGASNATPNTYAAAVTGTKFLVGSATANGPKAKAGSANAGFIAFSGVAAAAGTNSGAYYGLMDVANSTSTAWAWVAPASGGGALKAADALAVDIKLDDGLGTTGNVVSITVAATATPVLGTGTAVTLGCPASGTYTVTSSANDCNIGIRLGLNTGNLK